MGCCSSSDTAVAQNNTNANNYQGSSNNKTAPAATSSGKKTKILVLVYSTYGHCVQMARAAEEGAKQNPNTEVTLRRVAETLPEEVLEKMHATEAQLSFHDAIPVIANAEELANYDGFIFVFPTRFGMVPAQMKSFMDSTGGLWAQGKLVGKVGSVITSSATQHGGQEATILSFHTLMLHHGMSIVGLPGSWGKHGDLSAVNGGSFYGASTIANSDGSRMPSEHELDGAKFQGKHTASIAAKLAAE